MKQSWNTSLAVGATGMLAGALDWMAARSGRTFVVARNASSALRTRSRPGAVALDADWRAADAFRAAVEGSLPDGGVDLALLWMHSSGAPALDRLLDRLAAEDCLIAHVLSSASGDPSAHRSAFEGREGARARYVTVKLGAKPEGGAMRWLTDAEISDGAIKAMRTGRDVQVGEAP